MVLVVDDHDDTRRAVMAMLRADGYEAAGVASGPEALQLLKKSIPHCIILDLRMPEMDGMDVLRAIRTDPRLNNVSVIMFSAEIAEDLVHRAMSAGAQAFVQKGSLDWAEMQKVLREHCAPRCRPELRDKLVETKHVG